ncbi:MAG: hypothetical protein LBE56_12500 [Tannerella sp.]|jgi:hypothetical protein|nr:hypothetical protein [Tannerella sp.]
MRIPKKEMEIGTELQREHRPQTDEELNMIMQKAQEIYKERYPEEAIPYYEERERRNKLLSRMSNRQ